MRIAVTYEDGQIFQHFGHTETFKIYDVEEGKVVHSCLLYTSPSPRDSTSSRMPSSA